MARARMVAVVVPSPATSDVLEATTLTSLAPMFSNGSLNSISFETVTPSLVTSGPPNDLLRMTFRPVGPSVEPTALARMSTPPSILRRPASEKISCFATDVCSSNRLGLETDCGAVLLDDLGQDVGFAQDLDFLAVHLDLGARVLAEEDLVPLDHADLGTLAGIEQLAGAYRQHLAALGFLLGRIGKDDTAGRLLFRLDLLNHHPVFQGTNCQLCHCLMSFMHEFPKMNRYRSSRSSRLGSHHSHATHISHTTHATHSAHATSSMRIMAATGLFLLG